MKCLQFVFAACCIAALAADRASAAPAAPAALAAPASPAAPATSAAPAASAKNTDALQMLYSSDPGSLAVTGKVVGPNLTPQAGVPIRIQGPLGMTHVYTDSSGKWSLYKLPPGNYQATPVTVADPTHQQTVSFTVKEKGWFDAIWGSSDKAAAAPQIKLNAPYQH